MYNVKLRIGNTELAFSDQYSAFSKKNEKLQAHKYFDTKNNPACGINGNTIGL